MSVEGLNELLLVTTSHLMLFLFRSQMWLLRIEAVVLPIMPLLECVLGQTNIGFCLVITSH